MNNVMLDLETLGTAPGSVVLSIGAVTFDPDEQGGGIGSTFYTVISVEDSLRLGLTIDAGTLRWWAGQERATYIDALGCRDLDRTLAGSLDNFNAWLEFNTESAERKMWGNGADFDLTLLLACYRKAGIEAPWKFWNHRCYRTLRAIALALRPDVRLEKSNNHNALDDARNQAEHAVAILRAMR